MCNARPTGLLSPGRRAALCRKVGLSPLWAGSVTRTNSVRCLERSVPPVDLEHRAGHRVDVNVDGFPTRIAAFDFPFAIVILNLVESDHAEGSRRHHGALDRVSGAEIGEGRRRDAEERNN